MNILSLRIRTLLPLLTALALACPAFAQSAEDLKRENDQLKKQVQDLQRQLDAAKRQVEELQRRLDAATGGSASAEAPAAEVTIDESQPNASPRALFNAIVTSHDEAMKDKEMGRASDRTRTAYMRELERWVALANNQFKSQIEWTVRIEDMTTTRGVTEATLMAVDPVTGAELGDPFTVILSNAIMRRLTPAMQHKDVKQLTLAGVITPIVRLNPNRAERGAFDVPRFVAPFVEYGFSVEARSLVPVEEKKAEEPARKPDARSTPAGK